MTDALCHLPGDSVVVKEPTCTEAGQEDVRCTRCDGILECHLLEAPGHSFDDGELTVKPTANSNGVQVFTCSVCQYEEEREYVCPHEDTHSEVVKSPTCMAGGQQDVVCDLCSKVMYSNQLNKVSCSYGKWKVTRAATPAKAGERYKECVYCGDKITESYSFSMAGKNSIYIPGTGINHKMTRGAMTQGNIDKYNMVFCNGYRMSDGYAPYVSMSDIVVGGHNYRTLGKLHKTKVGQYIYLSVDGEIRSYKVRVSEYGVHSVYSGIVGKSTGANLLQTNYGRETLRIYTCHGGGSGRWMVLATRVS